ncbi:dephospho-CoA kinase [Candidatus Pelagibacter sp.]|nr:dephospho-CoA kinase [Candidatus Pelagibacter sp.]
MRRIALVGDIGSGKTFFSKLFKYPIFNADLEVSNLYKKDKLLFKKIKKKFPNKLSNFPLKKNELLEIIFQNQKNLNILGKIIHPMVRKKMEYFFKINKRKKFVILDIPLFLENKLNTKKDIIIFIDTDKKKVKKNLKKRKNINLKLINILRRNQLPIRLKKKKSTYIIKNNFVSNTAKKNVKLILKKLSE